MEQPPKSKLFVAGLVATVSGILLAVIGTIVGLLQTFNTIGADPPRATPEKLSQGISDSLVCVWIGIPIMVVGLVLLIAGRQKKANEVEGKSPDET